MSAGRRPARPAALALLIVLGAPAASGAQRAPDLAPTVLPPSAVVRPSVPVSGECARARPGAGPVFCMRAATPTAGADGSALLAGAAQAPADAWFGDDKLRHFFLSFAAANVTFGAARLAGLDRDAALPAALAAGALAGLGKEIDDARRGWRFSVRDLVWDAGGLAASALFLREVR